MASPMRNVPGGRVELPTPAFSGPRSTGELPRHRGSQRFYGCGMIEARDNRQQARSGKTERLKSLGRKTVMTTKGAFPKILEQKFTKNRNCRTGFSLSAF